MVKKVAIVQEAVDETVNEDLTQEEEVELPESEEEVVDEETEDAEEESEEESSETEEGESEDDMIVTIGDESPSTETKNEPAPEWVKELRKTQREMSSENKRLKAELEALKNPVKKVEALGKKPALSDPEIDYDSEKFEQALTAWHERKRAQEQEVEKANKARQAQEEAWKATVNAYNESKTKLKVKDYDDAEGVVQETLDVTQQGILLDGAENAALLVYALGKNPNRLKELATIKNPVKFTFAVAKLEAQLKVTTRKIPPPPEKTVSAGGAKTNGSTDSTLERLRKQAEKTGDYTQVNQYKQKLRAKGKA